MNDFKSRITQEILAMKQETLCDVFLDVEKRLNFSISVQDDTFDIFSY